VTTAGTESDRERPKGSSRTAIFFIQVGYLLALGAFVVAYRVEWIDPRKDFFGPVPFLVPWFGAVGAVLLSLTGVFDHRGRDWNPDYCFWHWARPLVGAIVATISVLIFQSGILAVGGETPNQAGGGTPKNLLYFIVAFIVGYREDVFRQLIRRIADIVLAPASDAVAGPVIERVEPASAGANSTVKIIGSGFAHVTSVKVGDAEGTFESDSDTRLTVTIPAGAAGSGNTTLVVTTRDGTTTTPFTVN
jgi:IPT/TIG domain